MFKKGLWFRMDLRSKINAPFYSEGKELPKIIIDAVREGKILPFKNDSLTTRISKNEFLKELKIPQADLEKQLFSAEDEINNDWGDDGDSKKNKVFNEGQYEYFPKQLFVVELKIDRVFDKRRSKMYNDIQAVTLIIPAEINPIGVDKVLGTFSYKELYENVFHSKSDGKLVDNPEAIWFNPNNSASHQNLGDAFDLGMYDAILTKYENPKNDAIVDIYGSGRKGLIHSKEAVYKLIEYEAMLWSY